MYKEGQEKLAEVQNMQPVLESSSCKMMDKESFKLISDFRFESITVLLVGCRWVKNKKEEKRCKKAIKSRQNSL